MKSLIIHIGYPKTATSTIQNRLFYKKYLDGNIHFLGKAAFDDTNFNPSGRLVSSLCNNQYVSSSINLEKDKLNIISNEDFPLSFYNIDNQTFLPIKNPIKTADNLKNYIDNHLGENINTQIVVFIRNQLDLIHSAYTEGYVWYFRHERSLNTFDKFLEQGLRKKDGGIFLMFYFYKVLKRYADLFGRENVHIFFYEDIMNDINCILKKFNKLFAFSENEIQNAFEKKDNVKQRNVLGYSTKKLTIQMILSDLVNKNQVLGKMSKNNYMKKYLKPFYDYSRKLNIGYQKNIPYIDNERKSEIIDMFYDDNFSLAEYFSLSKDKMKNYGYFGYND